MSSSIHTARQVLKTKTSKSAPPTEIYRACHGPTLVGRARPSIFDMMGRARPGPSNFNLVGRSTARPVNFSEDGPRRPGSSNFQRMGRRPAQPTTFSKVRGPARPIICSKVSARPGPSHGSEAHETRAIYGPARQLRGSARGFNGPVHGPAHVLSRTKRCMCIR